MHTEPDLRFIERAYSGRPYGYGRLPVPPPTGVSPTAVSRPQLMQSDPGGGGPRKSTDRAGAVLDLIDLWDRFKETFKEIPGLWRSLLGILATPIRWLRALFGLRGILAVFGVIVVLFILALAMIPLTTSGGRDARRAEGEQLMGSARDFARVAYSKTGTPEDAARAFEQEVFRGAFDGQYFEVRSHIEIVGSDKARIRVRSLSPEETDGFIEFDWKSGNSRVEWEPKRGWR